MNADCSAPEEQRWFYISEIGSDAVFGHRHTLFGVISSFPMNYSILSHSEAFLSRDLTLFDFSGGKNEEHETASHKHAYARRDIVSHAHGRRCVQCISDRAAGRGGNRSFFARHGCIRDGADIFVCGSAARIDAAHGRRFREKCRSGSMDNAAVRAIRADGRVHDARRRMVRRGADSKAVARRHTHGVVASHTRAEPPRGVGRLRVQRIFHGAAHGAQIRGGADIRAGSKNSGLCSDASILGGKGRGVRLRRSGARHNDIADKLADMRIFALQINEAPKAERKRPAGFVLCCALRSRTPPDRARARCC